MPKNTPLFVEIGQGLSLMVGLSRIPSWDSKQRPKKAKRGTIGFNDQTTTVEYFDGENWYGAQLSTK